MFLLMSWNPTGLEGVIWVSVLLIQLLVNGKSAGDGPSSPKKTVWDGEVLPDDDDEELNKLKLSEDLNPNSGA